MFNDGEVVNGFYCSRDEFGFSFSCELCGKNQFYADVPEKCDHSPAEWEVKMYREKLARREKLAAFRREMDVVSRQYRFKIVNKNCVDYGEWYPWETCSLDKYNEVSDCIKEGKAHYEVRELIVKAT